MIGLLTASFSVGQIVGPIVAGRLAEEGGFDLPLVLAAITVVVGALLLGFGAAAGRLQWAAFTTRNRVAP
jgi:MFS family permease